jgi:hypothetical protein
MFLTEIRAHSELVEGIKYLTLNIFILFVVGAAVACTFHDSDAMLIFILPESWNCTVRNHVHKSPP